MIKTFCCKKLLIHVRKRVILEILKVKGLNLSSLGYPWFVQASSVTLQISFTAQEHNQTVIHQSLRKTSSFDFKVNILKCRLFSLNLNNFFVQSTVHIYQKKPLSQGSLTFTNYYYFLSPDDTKRKLPKCYNQLLYNIRQNTFFSPTSVPLKIHAHPHNMHFKTSAYLQTNKFKALSQISQPHP